MQRLVDYRHVSGLAPGQAAPLDFGLQLAGAPGEGWDTGSWAGFEGAAGAPPCGAYALRFGADQPAAAVVRLD